MRWFVLGQSAEVIAQEARLERKRVLRALIVVRQAMVRDVPHVFSGVVEVDETYLGVSRAARRCTTAAEELCTTGTMRKD